MILTDYLEDSVSLEEALNGQELPLLLLLSTHGGQGLAIVSPVVLTALIELQTTGRVLSLRTDPRNSTPTDFALVGPILDDWFAAVWAAMPDAPGAPPRAIDRFADVRAAELSLEGEQFRRRELTLSFSAGTRAGPITFLLPGAAFDSSSGGNVRETEQVVLPLQTDIHVVLTRLVVPLAKAIALRSGDTLQLGEVDLRNAMVEAPPGSKITEVHLGRSQGRRAIRIGQAPHPEAAPVLDPPPLPPAPITDVDVPLPNPL